MRVIPRTQHEFVGITIDDHALSCCWIKRSTPDGYELAAYQHTILDRTQINQLRITNQHCLAKIIRSFLVNNSLTNAHTALALSGPALTEKIIPFSQASLSQETVVAQQDQNRIVAHAYLHPQEETRHAHYFCSMTRPLLFQYQLLAMLVPMNIRTITTQTQALLSLMKKISREEYATSDASINEKDMTPDIKKILAISSSVAPSIEAAHWHGIGASVGMYLAEKELDETH